MSLDGIHIPSSTNVESYEKFQTEYSVNTTDTYIILCTIHTPHLPYSLQEHVLKLTTDIRFVSCNPLTVILTVNN